MCLIENPQKILVIVFSRIKVINQRQSVIINLKFTIILDCFSSLLDLWVNNKKKISLLFICKILSFIPFDHYWYFISFLIPDSFKLFKRKLQHTSVKWLFKYLCSLQIDTISSRPLNYIGGLSYISKG